jgi:RNase H-like domain found in reverse transcriptase
MLCPIDPTKDEPIWVICDASVYGIGAMYRQGETWQTCCTMGFMSQKFTDAKQNYQVFKCETLAILEALLKWEDKLLGYMIHVVTDHKALEFFKMQPCLSSRQTRWMDYLT